MARAWYPTRRVREKQGEDSRCQGEQEGEGGTRGGFPLQEGEGRDKEASTRLTPDVNWCFSVNMVVSNDHPEEFPSLNKGEGDREVKGRRDRLGGG
jgi:hypothetical protein